MTPALNAISARLNTSNFALHAFTKEIVALNAKFRRSFEPSTTLGNVVILDFQKDFSNVGAKISDYLVDQESDRDFADALVDIIKKQCTPFSTADEFSLESSAVPLFTSAVFPGAYQLNGKDDPIVVRRPLAGSLGDVTLLPNAGKILEPTARVDFIRGYLNTLGNFTVYNDHHGSAYIAAPASEVNAYLVKQYPILARLFHSLP